jgi:hypothetical protein
MAPVTGPFIIDIVYFINILLQYSIPETYTTQRTYAVSFITFISQQFYLPVIRYPSGQLATKWFTDRMAKGLAHNF